MNGKWWVKSKTMFFAVVFILVALANLFGFGSFEPPEWAEQVASLLPLVYAVVMAILRIVTKEPVTLKRE